MKKQVLFISDAPPNNGMASSVLFYRHLKLLEEAGYGINVLVHEITEKGVTFPDTWNVVELPSRKWYYPPFRPNEAARKIRFALLYQAARPHLKKMNPDVVIGFMSGVYYSYFAAYVANRIGKPLTMFYHDRTETLRYRYNPKMQDLAFLNNSYVMEAAKVVWTVSPELVYHKWHDKFRVVYPIPETIPQKAQFRPSMLEHPVVGYAGTLYDEVVDSMLLIGRELQYMNGKLLFMTPQSDNIRKLTAELDNVVVVPTRGTTAACEYIRDNCSAFIVAYPERLDVMPWIDSCFPSKFTQFVQTGLPMLVLAPEGSAITRWCRRNKWIGCSSDFSGIGVQRLMAGLQKEAVWKAMAEQTLAAGEGDFNERRLQDLVEADLQQIIS